MSDRHADMDLCLYSHGSQYIHVYRYGSRYMNIDMSFKLIPQSPPEYSEGLSE